MYNKTEVAEVAAAGVTAVQRARDVEEDCCESERRHCRSAAGHAEERAVAQRPRAEEEQRAGGCQRGERI